MHVSLSFTLTGVDHVVVPALIPWIKTTAISPIARERTVVGAPNSQPQALLTRSDTKLMHMTRHDTTRHEATKAIWRKSFVKSQYGSPVAVATPIEM